MKRFFLLVLVVCVASALLTLSCRKQVSQGITEEQAQAIINGALKIWNEGNLAVVDEFYSQDFVDHDPMYPEPLVGIKAFKDALAEESKIFSEMHLRFDDHFIKDNKIVLVWTWSGVHSGPMALPSGGILPATGAKFKYSGVTVCRMENGKIAEFWWYINLLDLYLPMGFTLNPPRQAEPQIKK